MADLLELEKYSLLASCDPSEFMVKGGHADPYAAYGSGSKREQPTLSPVDGNGGGGDINDEGDFSSGADSPAPDSSSSDEEDIGDKDQGRISTQNWDTVAEEGLGPTAETLYEKAREGPEALLDFLKWEEREAVHWRMTLLVAELGATLRTHHELTLRRSPGHKYPGRPWIKVGKSLQPEVDRMLRMVYDAVKVAKAKERIMLESGSKDKAAEKVRVKTEVVEEMEEDESGKSSTDSGSGATTRSAHKHEVRVTASSRRCPAKVSKTCTECLLPDVLLPACDQEIEADIAALKLACAEANGDDGGSMAKAAALPKRRLAKNKSSSSTGSSSTGSSSTGSSSSSEANKENSVDPRNWSFLSVASPDNAMKVLKPRNSAVKVLLPERSDPPRAKLAARRKIMRAALKKSSSSGSNSSSGSYSSSSDPDRPKMKCPYEGCNYTTSRYDNYIQFHLPSHTGVYRFKCGADNGCTFKTTRADRLRIHKAGGRKTCPKKC